MVHQSTLFGVGARGNPPAVPVGPGFEDLRHQYWEAWQHPKYLCVVRDRKGIMARAAISQSISPQNLFDRLGHVQIISPDLWIILQRGSAKIRPKG